MPLEEVTLETMFELRDMQAARLWVMAPAVMETALELFGDDRLAHPQWPHVFVISHLQPTCEGRTWERTWMCCSQFLPGSRFGRQGSSNH